MTLVDRFIDVRKSSTGRKIQAMNLWLILPGHVLAAAALSFTLPHAEIASPRPLLLVVWLFVAHSLAMVTLGWWATRRGSGARWMLVAQVIPYYLLLASALVMLGFASTAMAVGIAVAGQIFTVWFDARTGIIIAASGVGFVAVMLALQLTHALSYAPLITDRSLDAQAEPWFLITVCIGVLGYLVFGGAGSTFAARVREVQQERLDQAHQELALAHQRLDEGATLIARYVPTELAEDILAGRVTSDDGYERRRITVFFSDLVGFSDVADELEPEDLALLINGYFTAMTDIARRHGGTVDELQGDALLIFFGAPRRTEDRENALNAVRMAREMQAALPDLYRTWESSGITQHLSVRMGIDTGVVTVGNFGSLSRLKYAALGKHVNIAARLQAQCSPGRILLSKSTWLLVRDEVPCEERGELDLKGMHTPVEAFEVKA